MDEDRRFNQWKAKRLAERREYKAKIEGRRGTNREVLRRALKVYPFAKESYYRLEGLESIDLLVELLRKCVKTQLMLKHYGKSAKAPYKKSAKVVTAFIDQVEALADKIMADPVYVPDREFLDCPIRSGVTPIMFGSVAGLSNDAERDGPWKRPNY